MMRLRRLSTRKFVYHLLENTLIYHVFIKKLGIFIGTMTLVLVVVFNLARACTHYQTSQSLIWGNFLASSINYNSAWRRLIINLMRKKCRIESVAWHRANHLIR